MKKLINLKWVLVGLVVVALVMFVMRENFTSGDGMPTVSSASYSLGSSGSKSTTTVTVSSAVPCPSGQQCGVYVQIFGKGPDGQYSKDPIDAGWSTSASETTYTAQMVSDPTYVAGYSDRYGIAQTFKGQAGPGGTNGPEFKFSA